MVRIGKVESKGRLVKYGPSFSKIQETRHREGSTFTIPTNDQVIDYFSCLSTLCDSLMPLLVILYTFA